MVNHTAVGGGEHSEDAAEVSENHSCKLNYITLPKFSSKLEKIVSEKMSIFFVLRKNKRNSQFGNIA